MPAVISEKPSIFIPSFEAKFANAATTLGRQAVFGQKRFAPVSTTGVPQYGQTEGGTTSLLSSKYSVAPRISGITSLLRLIRTRHLSFIFFLFMSPRLLSVALRTVAPASSTGSTCASGVSLPVLPTCQTIFSSTVVVSSASNLKAIAQRGNLSVSPRTSRKEKSFILTTAPSVRISSFFLLTSISSIASIASSIPRHTRTNSPVLNPFLRKKSRHSVCERKVTSDA